LPSSHDAVVEMMVEGFLQPAQQTEKPGKAPGFSV
jgi:hypothetical protein